MNFYDPVKNGGSSRQFSDSILLKPDQRLFNTPKELAKVMNNIQRIFNVSDRIKAQSFTFLGALDKDSYYSLVLELYEYSKYAKEAEYDPKNEDVIISHLKVKYIEYLTNLIRRIGVHESYEQLQHQIHMFILIIKAVIESHLRQSEEPIYWMIFFFYYHSRLHEVQISEEDEFYGLFSSYVKKGITLQQLEDELFDYLADPKLDHINLLITFTKGDNANALVRLKTFVVEMFG